MKYLRFIYIFLLVGCTFSSNVDLQPTFIEDDSYFQTYAKNTRSQKIYDNFENKFSIEATYLSPEFRVAFSERLKRLYLQDNPSLGEANDKAGFFVVIHSPDDEDMNLGDTHLWSILLSSSNPQQSPVLVKRLGQKKRWEPFFNVNKWTKEYLILFDTPSISTGNSDFVEKRLLNLVFAHSTAKVEFSW